MSELPFGTVFSEQKGSAEPFPGFLLVDHGRTETADPRALAACYGQMTLRSVEFGLDHLNEPEAAFPALYLARHTFELYLKGLVPDWNERRDKKKSSPHHIDYLVDILRERLLPNYDEREVTALSDFLHQFAMLSPKSMEFRYRDGAVVSFGDAPLDDPEIWVDFIALRESLIKIFEALDNVWRLQTEDAL
ncbi:MAG: hypothetical protein HWE39_19735 [Oceanospirillaceae bacterium]|uniref:hypothetical protein n=1 Tax=Salipiger sp. HF18 TaxID=2721557 RepID=UPI00142D987F|nr:hypothetical protein [Salipiger sp. HF18]NIY95455.1 hypothetical protein [Salipiger sp. HF18]NVK43482.1 hypothetical protein [Oceanospirillaceae bacterium]